MRLYRTALRLYPAPFRARFGDEMLQLYNDARAYGGRPLLVGDVLTSAPRLWWEEGTMRRYMPAVGFLVLAFAGALMIVGNTRVVPVFVVGLFATFGLLYLVVAAFARTGRRGAEFDYSSRHLRWWWIPAGLVGAFEGLFGVGQLIREPKWENAVALVVLSAFAALVFGGLFIRNRRAGNWMIAFGVAPMLPFFWIVIPTVVALVVIVAAMAENVRMSHPHPAV